MKEILQHLNEKSYLGNIVRVDKSMNVTLDFTLRNGYIIPLKLWFDDHFPAELPFAFIDKDKFKVPNKPHIFSFGLICYLEKEGVIWSDHIPLTLDFVFQRIEKVLFESDDTVEYHKEFGYYFGTQKNKVSAFSVIESGVSDKLERIPVHVLNRKPLIFFRKTYSNRLLMIKTFKHFRKEYPFHALYIPLNKTYTGRIPRQDQPWSSNEIVNIVNECYEGDINKIHEYKENKKDFYYLFRVKLLTEQHAFFGIWYKKKSKICKSIQPILEPSVENDFDVIPVSIYRFDEASIYARGGGELLTQKVLIIGCGAVGSDLAFLLSRSGLKNIDIVDKDELHVENTYRHFLGFESSNIDNPKVELMKTELEKRYPMLEVNAFNGDILSLLSNKKIEYCNYDLVISAIGDPNVERVLNIEAIKTKTPMIFTWVEAYGIGGHVLTVNNHGNGCFNCMYDSRLRNMTSFAVQEDKPFTKNFDGCSGTFTPYGSVDAMETATLASRVSLKILHGEKMEHTLISWKGSSKNFLENGHQLTDRYLNFDEDENKNLDEIFSNGCMHCSGEINDNKDK